MRTMYFLAKEDVRSLLSGEPLMVRVGDVVVGFQVEAVRKRRNGSADTHDDESKETKEKPGRRTFTVAQRRAVVKKITAKGWSMRQAEKKLGISDSVIYAWKKKYGSQ
jgi:hypothetical protein